MAFTRKMLKALGIEDEQADQIMEAHAEVTDSLKAERDSLKDKLTALDGVSEELEALKVKQGDGFQARYEAEKKAFEDYKQDVEAKAAKAEKRELYRALLAKAGIDAKRLDSVLKISDLESLEVEDGALVDAEKLVEGIKDEWQDFIVQTKTEGAPVANPPKGGGQAVTKEQFGKMSLRERNELYNSDRAAYDALVKD